MSSSISLGTSVDLETWGSSSELELAEKSSKPVNVNKRDGQKLLKDLRDIRLIEHQYQPEDEPQDEYQRIDVQMSRNSLEYPEQQARNVDEWLESSARVPKPKPKSANSVAYKWGNVIGVRGYPVEGRCNSERTRKSNSCDYKFQLSRLQSDHVKLQSDHNKLQSHFNETIIKFKRQLKKRDLELDSLRQSIEGRGARCKLDGDRKKFNTITEEHRIDCEDGNRTKVKLQHELEALTLRVDAKEREEKQEEERIDRLRSENNRLKEEAELMRLDLEAELNKLRDQVKLLSLEPGGKLVISLRNENKRLREMNELELAESRALKESYQKLEARLCSLIEEQKFLESDKDAEISKLLVELCRLQVYQPKLEMTLATEASIKSELQAKLESLAEENGKLREQLSLKSSELLKVQMAAKNRDSLEAGELQEELTKWQDSFYRLKREKSDADELLRASNFKIELMDARQKGELESIREQYGCEISNLMQSNTRLEEERNGLRAKVSKLERQISDYELSNGKLSGELMELSGKIVAQENGQKLGDKLKVCEEQISTLKRQLEVCETRNRKLAVDCENSKGQLERSRLQLEQFRERFKLQQRALDETREKKEQELSRLRVNLNLERYNRQVALQSIEKELRCTLQELDTMKYRFARRLAAQSNDNNSGHNKPQTTRQQPTECSADRPSGCCKRIPMDATEIAVHLTEQSRGDGTS